MKLFYYLSKWTGFSTSLVFVLSFFISHSLHSQVNIRNSRPTLDPITDYTTSFSENIRYIELNNITPGEETDQQVTIEVSTEDEDLIESIGADLVDNGKGFIHYQLKEGAAGTATVKVVVTDNGPTPSRFTRTFHITIESLHHDITPPSSLEEVSNRHLKAFPNPASISTRLFFSTPNNEDRITVDLYTLSGTKIKQLFTGSSLANQSNYVDVNSKDLASGVYIVRLTGQTHTSNLKLVVAK